MIKIYKAHLTKRPNPPYKKECSLLCTKVRDQDSTLMSQCVLAYNNMIVFGFLFWIDPNMIVEKADHVI